MPEPKLRFDEIPPRALQEVARAATVGAGRKSVELPVSQQFAALMRHAVAFYTGEDHGSGDRHKHMAAVSLRAMHLLETVRARPDLDDRPGRRRSHDRSECPCCRREHGSDDT